MGVRIPPCRVKTGMKAVYENHLARCVAQSACSAGSATLNLPFSLRGWVSSRPCAGGRGWGGGGRRLVLSRREPAEFTGVEKREYSQPASDTGNPVWKTAKSPPLGIQGVLVKLFPLLTEFDLRDRCRCCAHSTHHSPCGAVCASDREEPQLFPRGQWLSCGS